VNDDPLELPLIERLKHFREVLGDYYADYLDTVIPEVEALKARVAELGSALAEALDALERSYDYTEWPADGSSFQEKTAAKVRAVLDKSPDADGESRTDEQRYNEHIKVMEDLKRGEP
jgi:hypothetical protein